MRDDRANADNLLDALVTALDRAVAAEAALDRVVTLCSEKDNSFDEWSVLVSDVLEAINGADA